MPAITAPRGVEDVLPAQSANRRRLENTLRDCALLFGFPEIRFPVFEHTELFRRGIGDATDVVQKEMYTFEDKGGRSLTLRPEGTASVARAFIEHGLHMTPMPFRCHYIAPNFRYEKPQKGRLRQHHQFGAECFGSALPGADAELISFAHTYLRKLGLDRLTLELNSIGCADCRPMYREALLLHLRGKEDALCADCRERMERSPLRVLDCKREACRAAAAEAPKSLDCLCKPCGAHHDALRSLLTSAGIPYRDNPLIVRGLDYYNRTVFEFCAEGIGAQNTVCAGGRYDGLITALGGPDTPAVGFGSGIERLLLAIETIGVPPAEQPAPELYIAPMGERAEALAFTLCLALRDCGLRAERDLCGRGLKAQMKYADKCGAAAVLVLGDTELDTGRARLKTMNDGAERDCVLDARAIAALLKGE